jgi:DNA-binding CsgD family transcriptional regulator
MSRGSDRSDPVGDRGGSAGLGWALGGFDTLLGELAGAHRAGAAVVLELDAEGELETLAASGLADPTIAALRAEPARDDRLANMIRQDCAGRTRHARAAFDLPAFAASALFETVYRPSNLLDALACGFSSESGQLAVALFRGPGAPFNGEDFERLEIWRRRAEPSVETALTLRARFTQRIRRAFGLTRREATALRLMLAGAPRRRAAQRLGITENTYKFHQRSVFGKLGVSRTSEVFAAVLAAIDVRDILETVRSAGEGDDHERHAGGDGA